MRRLFIFILLLITISCNQDPSNAKANPSNLVNPEISDNKDISGAWTMCSTLSNGVMIMANQCRTIIFIGNGTAYVGDGVEIYEYFIWTLKNSELKIMYKTKDLDRTFPDTTYYAHFEREGGRMNLTLSHKDAQYFLSKK